MPVFTPPLRLEWTFADGVSAPSDKRFWSHFGPQPRGRSVIKIAGVWTTVDVPTSDQVSQATPIVDTHGYSVPGAFIGGHEYEVTATVAAELTAAGYVVT